MSGPTVPFSTHIKRAGALCVGPPLIVCADKNSRFIPAIEKLYYILRISVDFFFLYPYTFLNNYIAICYIDFFGRDKMSITQEFFSSSSIEKNADTVAIMDFLSSPESVNKMIVLADLGLPSLAGVVKELEDRFADCALFPLHHHAPNSNAPNRRNIGWMVRFIMREYGYTPVMKGIDASGNTRIGKFSGSKYFGNAAVYARTIHNPNRALTISST